MLKQVEVKIPEWFDLDDLRILHTIISPLNEDYGVVVASENFDNTKTCNPTVRLYLVQQVEGQYEFTKELDAFSFNSIEKALAFSAKLPSLNAIDLVMMLNKEELLFA